MKIGKMTSWKIEIPLGKLTFSEEEKDLLGYEPDSFGHYDDFLELVHPEDHQNVVETLEHLLKG